MLAGSSESIAEEVYEHQRDINELAEEVSIQAKLEEYPIDPQESTEPGASTDPEADGIDTAEEFYYNDFLD